MTLKEIYTKHSDAISAFITLYIVSISYVLAVIYLPIDFMFSIVILLMIVIGIIIGTFFSLGQSDNT